MTDAKRNATTARESAADGYALNTSMEAMLLEHGDKTSLALVRAKKRVPAVISAEQYAMIVDWMGHVRVSRGLGHNTGRNYIDSACLFMEAMNAAGTSLGAVTSADVELWMQRLYLERRESPSTRNGRLIAVRQFYAWRERAGMGLNPARAVRGPKKRKPEPRKYSNAQLRAMFGAIDREMPQGVRDYALLLFFLATGARREEVVELNLSQVALQQRVGAVKLNGKGARERSLSFEGEAVYALLEWLALRDTVDVIDTDAVFVGLAGRHKGRRLSKSGVWGVIKAVQKRAKLKLSEGSALHMLRSTYATTLYDQHGDIEVVRIALGHDDINTTRRYIAISDRQLSTRISSDFLNKVTGGKRNGGTPGWAELALRKHRRAA